MATEILGKAVKIGFLQQDKSANHWSAPRDATADYQNQYYAANVSLPKHGVTIDQIGVINSSSGVMREENRQKINAVSGLNNMNFEGWVTKETWASHLCACFQKVTEAATTPYRKQFSPADSLLDWANNEGFIYTVAFNPGVSARGQILENAVLEEYNLMINPMAAGVERNLKHSGLWVGNELNDDQTFSGTWASPSNTLYNTTSSGFEADLNVVVGGTTLTDICFKNFEMRWKANYQNRCATTGGKANNYHWAPSLTFVIDLEYTSTTAPLIGAYKSGSNTYISAFTNSVADTSEGGVTIATTKGELTADVEYYEGEYQAVRLQFEALRPSAGWGDVVVISDAIDGGY